MLLVVLLTEYKLKYKKITFLIIAVGLASIYLVKGEALAEYKYIPFVIGSFFMFRSISFLHEIKFLKNKVPLIDKINYFLLTPNFSLPLFPIVDYKTFITSYEGINSKTLSRSSLLICRGIVQMIIYRFIYHNIIIPFDEIHNLSQVFVYIIANFMVVLRVIGAFHIAIGLVILTGYNIPDVFNNIFFSTGFSNLWRRTNMYWRNFMVKTFYYPIYFKIKKHGIYKALFISTFICFFITWILHTYQWFWLKGTFPLESKDAIFWGSFGLLVSVNTLIQQKNLDNSSFKKQNPFEFVKQAFAGLIVLLVMSVLWSIWTSNSLSDWWTLIKFSQNFDTHQLKTIITISFCYVLVAAIFHWYERHKENKSVFFKRHMKTISYSGFILIIVVFLISELLILKGRTLFYWQKLVPLITEQLNKADLVMIDNGYYTNLISTNNY